jgi:hypothetical protein
VRSFKKVKRVEGKACRNRNFGPGMADDAAECRPGTSQGRVDDSQWQIFDLSALKQWPVAEAVKALGISAGRVYIARYRVSGLLKKEIKRLGRM